MHLNKWLCLAVSVLVIATLGGVTYAQSSYYSFRTPGARWSVDTDPSGTRIRGEVGSGGYRLRYDTYRPNYGRYGLPLSGPPMGGYYPPVNAGGYGPPIFPQGRVTFRPQVGVLFNPQSAYEMQIVNNLPVRVLLKLQDPVYGQERETLFVSNNRTSSTVLRGPTVIVVVDNQSPVKTPIGRPVLVDRPGILVVDGGGGEAPYFSPSAPAPLMRGPSPSLLVALEDFRNEVRLGRIPSPYQARRLLQELLASGIDVPPAVLEFLVGLAS